VGSVQDRQTDVLAGGTGWARDQLPSTRDRFFIQL